MLKTVLLVPPSDDGLVRDTLYGCWHRRKFVAYSLPPLMLYYLHALLPDSVVLDAPAQGLDREGCLERISSYDPGLVVASMGSFTQESDGPFLRGVREETGCRVVVFGEFPTARPQEALRFSDIAIRGEPETALREIAQFPLSNSSKPPHLRTSGLRRRAGVCTRGNITATRARVGNLDALPFPKRSLAKRDKYSFPFTAKDPFTTLLATRGCPFECIFCSVPLVYGRSFRKRSPKSVVAEMMLLEEQGFKEALFRDENLTLDRGFTRALCDEMLAQGVSLRWMANSRVDTVDGELLSLMRKSGCTLLKFGVESFSDETLKKIKKGTTPSDVQRAFTLARDVGIGTVAHMILGLPGETEADIKRNVDRLLALDPTYASFDVVLTYPGTELEHLSREGNASTLPEAQLERLHDWAFKRFYLRPRVIGRHMLKVRSPAELFSKAEATLQLWRGLLTKG